MVALLSIDMTMTVDTDRLATNRDRLLTVRAVGFIVPPSAPGLLPDPDGINRPRPGQGGVALNVGLGNHALAWESDHLEPGASIAHPDPTANRALQILSCVGNAVRVTSGGASGHSGSVIGKHGTTVVAFAAATLAMLAPGDAVCVDTCGVGLALDDFPQVHLHSVSPDVLESYVTPRADTLVVRVVATLPPEVAAAGIGFDARWANIDIETHRTATPDPLLQSLRFGDLVLLPSADHRYGRQHNPAWSTVGVIAHGASVSGGHGLGMASLLTAPSDMLVIEHDTKASLTSVFPESREGS